MRLWLLDVKKLCRKHLLGEHVECHMFVGTINKGKSIDGYLKNGLVDTDKIKSRHDELAKEMERRGIKHNSPLEYDDKINKQSINVNKNLIDLMRRCVECYNNFFI